MTQGRLGENEEYMKKYFSSPRNIAKFHVTMLY